MENIVFMGCSSRDAISDEYKELTTRISKLFVDNNYSLATGGASTGMMGTSFLEFHNNNKNVYAYTVSKYEEDLENLNGAFKFIYEDTFDRTKCLYKKGSIIIFLPGGTGTLAELFASIEENRTTNNPKQIILYNYNGFFDKVLDLIYYCVTNKFNDESIYSFFKVISTEEELKQILNPENKSLKLEKGD